MNLTHKRRELWALLRSPSTEALIQPGFWTHKCRGISPLCRFPISPDFSVPLVCPRWQTALYAFSGIGAIPGIRFLFSRSQDCVFIGLCTPPLTVIATRLSYVH
ncbi:hypothetical protein DENSPDRAFT_228973 [Dentipellis sp. KUC8613]|nr:hypothetical protein DENSPDRAFT_228973 [Dentipellis sp. KUC8613]